MLTLLYPWGLLSLLSLGVVVYLYFFVFKGKRIEVSSLHFWRISESYKKEGSKRKRLPLSIPFLLEMLSALLLALLVSGPLITSEDALRHRVVILDGSASMNASTDRVSFRRKVREAMKRYFSTSHEDQRITLIESGFDPHILNERGLLLKEALPLLDAWRPSGPAHDLMPALELAHALTGEETPPLLITDHLLDPPDAEVIAIGEPLENTGWVSAHWTSSSKLFALVRHYGNAAAPKKIVIRGNGNPIGERTIDFAERDVVPLELTIPEDVDSIRIELPHDALENDNTLWMARPRKIKIPAFLHVDHPILSAFFKRAIRASRHLELSDTSTPGLLFTDHEKESFHGFRFRMHGSSKSEPLDGPFRIHNDHPISRGLDLNGVIWSADPEFRPEDGTTILACDDIALAVLKGKDFILNLDPDKSNVFDFPAWPVLVDNVADYVYHRSPGLKRFSYRLGESLSFDKPVSWDGDVVVEDPEGEEASFSSDSVLYGRFEREGIYRILHRGEEMASLNVNLFSMEESDLTSASNGTSGNVEKDSDLLLAEGRSPHRECALIVLLMMLTCWWILERRSS